MNKKIYLIRHGQTEYNLKGILQGSGVDTDLNETGLLQAEAFFKMYHNVPFKKIYISGLKRTKQSVQRFIDQGIPYQVMPEFNEISWGERDGKMLTTGSDTYYSHVVEEWNKGNVELKTDGGESPVDVSIRLRRAMGIITEKEGEDVILICMHGRAMRILLATVLNYSLQCMDYFEHYNLCLYTLNYTGSMYSIDLFNSVEHLKELKEKDSNGSLKEL